MVLAGVVLLGELYVDIAGDERLLCLGVRTPEEGILQVLMLKKKVSNNSDRGEKVRK
jgi:hypothetical protein